MFRKILVAALAALVTCAGAAVAVVTAPLEAYGRLPSLTDVRVSPDGNAIAYVRGTTTRRVVVAQSLTTNQVLGMINVSDTKLRDLRWADNHTLLITTSVTARPFGLSGHRQEWALAQSYDVQTKAQHALLQDVGGKHDQEAMNVVAGPPEPRIIDGHTVVFVRGIYFPGEAGYLALFRIDLTSNTTRMVSSDRDTHAEDWVIDQAGNIVAESSYFENSQHWKLAIYRDGGSTDVMDVAAPIETPNVEGLTEDEKALVVSALQPDGSTKYEQVSLKDGGIAPWQRASVGFGNVMADPRSGHAIGGMRVTDKDDYVFFDPRADGVWRAAKADFPNATDIDLVSWSDDMSKVVVHVFGETYGDTYYVVDTAQHKIGRLGSAYDGIVDVCPEQWIEYKAADGRQIGAYLTLPLNREAKNLPLIVLPHGGPHARDNPGFDWFSQALASRGYAVLQPQFRGSDGFGTDLLYAGFGEFGKKMQTDLSDGVRALAAKGLADPKRVCIVGASYGGYAALAGATLDTGVYRCVVSIAGISDIRGLLRYWQWPRNTEDRNQRFWDRFLGVSDSGDSKLDAISPIKHVDKVSIPILLIHGRDDTVVPFDQSDDMADALKDARKPYEFVKLSGEDHWLSKSETRLQMLEATLKFLEANNPPN
ncbi:MAG: S9 family peptidase [Alphaproteobacteria bacterium]|nr:S9 family peptidase [Alphaproteobacteria bacterium]